jgi:hypothetical protein
MLEAVKGMADIIQHESFVICTQYVAFSMAAALTECSEEHRSVIRFLLWSETVETDDIYWKMTLQYGDNWINERKDAN